MQRNPWQLLYFKLWEKLKEPDCSRKWCSNNCNSHKREKARGDGSLAIGLILIWIAEQLWEPFLLTDGNVQKVNTQIYAAGAFTLPCHWGIDQFTLALACHKSSRMILGIITLGVWQNQETSCTEQWAVAVILFLHFPFLGLAVLIQFLALPQTFCAGLKNKHDFSAIQFLIYKIIIKLGDE